MSRLFSRLTTAALVIASSWVVGPQRAVFAQPEVTHAMPGALKPGTTTQIRLHGTKLTGPMKIWTSFPSEAEVLVVDSQTPDSKSVLCNVSLGSAISAGVGGIVVANGDGVSDVVYVMIDDLASATDDGKNHASDAAQVVSLPIAVDGQCDGTLADFYRFTAKAGERISCEVLATRLGWDFDPLVRVLDEKGRELLLADDDAASGPDPRFVFTAPAGGDYVLELRDNRYKAGGRYRLRLGDFSLASGTLPIFAEPGMPVCSEGMALSDPCLASGVLQQAGERDVFPFQAAKGTVMRFRAITRSVGSPAILSLRALDAGGKQLAESPVTESDEPALSFKPPEAGAYQLAVEELAGRGGSDFSYAVECKSGPQFSLVFKNVKDNRLRYAVKSGATISLDVQCVRAGYDGSITLSVESPRAGWQVSNNVIEEKANEVKMSVQPPEDFGAGELAELRVVGRATVDTKEIAAPMSTIVQLRAARPQMPYPPLWQDGLIFVSGKGSE